MMTKRLTLLILVLTVFSCRPEKTVNATNSKSYFDLKGYFQKEINRYNSTKPFVQKSVSINGIAESKKFKVKDWAKELAVFTDADINKSAWKGAFREQLSGDDIIYSTTNKKIPVKKLLVFKKAGEVSKIEIISANLNLIYHSNDTLTYYPDSLYSIVKQQKIRLMEGKRYEIVGKIK